MKGRGAPFACFVLSACSLNVHLYDHGYVGREAMPTQGDGDGQAAPTQGGQQQTQRPSVLRGRYAVFHITSTPITLAKATLISDGRDNTISRVLGETPLTFRMRPGTNRPIGPESCGRNILLKVEKTGFHTEVITHKIYCSGSQSTAETSQNEITVTLSPVSGVP